MGRRFPAAVAPAHAVELGLGVGGPRDIAIVTDDVASRRYADRLTGERSQHKRRLAPSGAAAAGWHGPDRPGPAPPAAAAVGWGRAHIRGALGRGTACGSGPPTDRPQCPPMPMAQREGKGLRDR